MGWSSFCEGDSIRIVKKEEEQVKERYFRGCRRKQNLKKY